jgi:hypothetical protein
MRMKSQLSEARLVENNSSNDDKLRADTAETRCRALEKQRIDLIGGCSSHSTLHFIALYFI